MDATATARKWKRELELAKKREKDWFDDAERIVKRYRGEEKKKNRYNVLWSNTEILRPSLYNSKPQPDVRRRFRDADPLGKAVCEILNRSLQVFVDGDEFDDALKNDVLDGLLPGRGISRIRYIPKLQEIPKDELEEDSGAPDQEEEPYYEVSSELVCVEHVDWRDFRHGYGRVWAEVPWEAFRHKLTKSEAIEKFGETELGTIEFTVPEITDDKYKLGDQTGETEKVAEFWEIWDKTHRKVFFMNEAHQELLYPKDNPDGAPPLDFECFFPNPRPLAIVENTGSLIPIPLFHLYEDQADQLDILTGRINKIVKTLRLRGVYDSRLPEMADVLSNDDNEMTPIQNAQAWADGGLDKAISWVPVDKNAQILESLYDARERQKAIIDELLGISDIIRGATDPQETATSQQLKSNYGSIRLSRMQEEVKRYARDMMRLASDAMSQKFSPQTFEEMTELKFPTMQQKKLMQLQFQQQASMAPPGAPPPQPPAALQVPSWEDLMQVLRSTELQHYKIDVETDSMIAGTLSSDMAGLSQVLQAVTQTITELTPIIQAQSLPVDAAKEIVMAVVRRARLGSVVEDAFDRMQPPKPPPDPEAGKAQAAMQQTQAKVQGDIEVAKIKAQLDAQVAQAQQQAQAQQDAQEQALEAQRAQADAQLKMQMDANEKSHQAQLEQLKQQAEERLRQADLLNQRLIADANNQTKVLVAEITAKNQQVMQAQQQEHDQKMASITAAMKPQSTDASPSVPEAPTAGSYDAQEQMRDMLDSMKQMMVQLSAPKTVVRDGSGRIVGVRTEM